MSISAFWQLYDNIIPLILHNTFGLGETITGGIMALDNVLALFLLPLFGYLSDKTNTKLGKRIPFIVIGTVISVVFMMILPIADQKQNFVLFFIPLGIALIAMGIYRSPAVALMPDLTPKPLRSKANAVINLMGAVGGIFTLVLIRVLIPNETRPDYTMLFLYISIFMIISVLILTLTIREKKSSEEKTVNNELKKVTPSSKNNIEMMPKEVQKSLFFILASVFLWFTAYNAITTAFSRYALEVWGLTGGSFANALMVATGAAILSYIPIGILSSNIGRKKTIIGGIIIMSISYFFGFLFTQYTPWINLIFAFTGIGWAAINVNSYPMVVEMSRSSDVGKYTGYYYTFSMAAQIVTPILSGFLLENVSYRTLFPYAIAFSLLSLLTMIFVRHGDSKPPRKKSKLENFDIED
nr:MFS transporter [Alkalibaculum sporogenes]